ncbi:MAG TPA: glycosyltransferase, partial [Pseudomonas sp.]|nr:glycosyltransferase [Pseudomonas sp.]
GEWVFRLLKEPKRLFARYVLGNPLFLLRALLYARAPGQRAQRRS